jgi:signal transduction histidine kinase
MSMQTDPEATRLTPAEVKTLFLFESLTDEQLAWIADHGYVERFPAGVTVFAEGEPATCFFTLLSGVMTLSRRVGDDDIETVRTEQRGVYMGATQSYLREDEGATRTYAASMRALGDCEFFVMAADDFGTMMRDWFPMAIHLLEGLFYGMRSAQALIGERQRLTALGALSAGLMHELNNPAAAAVRATGALRQRVAGMRHKLGMLADGRIEPSQLDALVVLQEEVIERAAKAPKLTAMQASDAEDALADWMDERGVTGGWDLAPVFVQGGIDVDCLTEIEAKVDHGLFDQAVHWLGYALETEQLMSDIEDATGRVSSLVTAAKQYSQLDRAAHQWIDVHSGLDSTLVMLNHKIGKIKIIKEYDRSLPQIPAHPAELNQVWTNLIDNAVQAMGDTGALTIRTSRDGDQALIEVCDTGPGVPPDLLKRVFEPFFTTKAVGEGTGLGLDISFRIVVNGHRGNLSVVSEPGDTRFQVRLPLTEPPSQ